MMNLKKIDPLTLALVFGLVAAFYWKKNGEAPKKEAYCGGRCSGS